MAIDDFEKHDVRVYPNPVTDYLILSNENDRVIEVKIYSVTGKEIQVKLENNRIDMRDLNAGIYLLKVDTNFGTSNMRIIKN